MAYQPIEPVGLGRNVSAEMMKGGPKLQQEIKQMGPNTIKMIALQQIADQQKQKAMQANLQAQPNPATVVQQLEQQLGGMGQPQQSMGLPPMRDKAQQVGGALAQKQQQQQKNMQRAAQGQGRPMMAGGGLLSRPAPNIDPRYFEGGGIVAFAQGKEVRGYEPTDEEIAAERARLAQSNSYFETVPDSVIRSRLVAQYKPEINKIPESEVDAEFERLKGPSSAMKKTRLEPYSERGYGDIDREKIKERLAEEKGGVYKKLPPTLPLGEGVRKPSEKPLEGIEALAAEMTGQLDTSKPLAPYSGPKIPQPIEQGAPKVDEKIDVSVKEEVEVDVPKVSATGIDIPQSLKDAGQRPSTDKITEGLGALKTAGINEEAAARTDYRKQMQLDPELKEEMNTMARRTKEREENYKPSRATTIREALAGAANRGSLGSVGAGISGAMSAREGDIQKRKDSLFKARQDSLDKLVMRSDDIAKGALAYGADARKGFKADARTLVDAEVAMYSTQSSDARQARQQEADIAIANAGQQFKAEVENVRSTLKARADADLASYRKDSTAIAREGNTATATKNKNTLVRNIVNDRNKLEIKIAEVIAERASALDSIETEKPESLKDGDGNFDEAKVTKWKKDILDGMALQYAPILASYDALLKDQGIDMPERVAPKEEDTDELLAADAVITGV
jgi:hypothetical protein